MRIDNTGWIRVLRFILPYLLIAAIFQLIGSMLVGIDPLAMDLEKPSSKELIIVFFDLLAALTTLWIFTVKADKEKFLVLGFQKKGFFKESGTGFILGALAVVTGYFLLLGLNEIQYKELHFYPLEISISTALFLFVSISEETVFRGYILRNLMISFNKYLALTISAILFTVVHLINPHINPLGIISLFCAGILLGLAYMYTKKLWLAIAIHFSWNLLQTLMGFNVSGRNVYSLIEIHYPENNRINGGSFGFEGSIISIVIQLLIILGLYLYYREKTYESN